MLQGKNDEENMEDFILTSQMDECPFENENSTLKNILVDITNEYRCLDFVEIKDNFSKMLKKIYDELIVPKDYSYQGAKLKTSLKKYLSIIMEIFFGFADQMNKSIYHFYCK